MPPRYNQVIASKMKKTRVYESNSFIKPYIPETVFLTQDKLVYMLNNYPKVVFKPNIGERGMYVGSIMKTTHNNSYYIHYLTEHSYNLSSTEVYDFIKELAPKKTFKKWLVTGYIARIAADNKMVTNLDSGGKGMPLKEFIRSTSYSSNEITKLKKKMRFVSKKIAICLNKKYRNLRELGVDFGVDNELHPWVLEVNTSPGYWRFKYFKDKRLYNRLIKYHYIIANSVNYREIPRMNL